MFKWIEEYLKSNEEMEARSVVLQQSEAKRLKEAAIKELRGRENELKQLLIEAGIHPIKRVSWNMGANWIQVYGTLNGKLISAKMTRSGGLTMSYVGKDKQ
jgi:hypothetical protein